MVAPTRITIPAGQWTKVATAVRYGLIIIIDHSYTYRVTMRDTGDGPPTDPSEGLIFDKKYEQINAVFDKDVYIYSSRGGVVEVWL